MLVAEHERGLVCLGFHHKLYQRSHIISNYRNYERAFTPVVVDRAPDPATYLEAVAAYQDLLRNKNAKPKTVSSNGSMLRKVARDLGGPIWTPTAFENRGARRAEAGISMQTRRREQIVVRQFVDFLLDPARPWGERFLKAYGAYPIQPLHNMNEIVNTEDLQSRSDGVRPLHMPEARWLFKYLDDVAKNSSSDRERRQALRDGALFKTMHALGLRCMEAGRLRLSDCAPVGDGTHFGNFGQVRVTGKAKAFGDERTRTVYSVGYFGWIGIVLQNHVDNVLPMFRRGDGNDLFVTEKGHALDPSYVSARFTKIRDAANLPKACTAHGLRRLFATTLAIHGVDLWFLQSELGHTQISTTQGYVHIPDDHTSRMVREHQTAILRP